jgi:hypothetical protein
VVGQLEAKELTNRKAVNALPGDSALGLDTFEVANQEHAKKDAGWNTRTAPIRDIFKGRLPKAIMCFNELEEMVE